MKKFKTESKRMLDLMINSIYTNREIFIRELLSNSSDAIDKLYYKSLNEGITGLTRDDFSIKIDINKEKRTITFSDNGIGMTGEELENNLGTIAKSGSFDFKKDLDKKEDIDIIGQFGVGFYSAFMVADKVEVLSKAFGSEKAFKWTSNGTDGYDIEESQKADDGTQITLFLKADGEEKYSDFLEEYQIRELVKKYSDYIRYPIKMEVTKYKEEGEGDDKKNVPYKEIETLNSMIPLWKKQKSEVTDEQYNSFYKDKFYDYTDPMKVITISMEGAVDYKALLFIPKNVPYNFYTKNFEKGLMLYTDSVMITEKCKDLIPDYFGFVRGIVDSNVTLNISRETVQQNRQLKAIGNSIEKKIKTELSNMLKNEREKYNDFFNTFGLSLKYGIYSSYGANAETLKDLIMFKSAKSGEFITLREYVDNMGENKKIIYATGKSVDAIKAMPQTQILLEKGNDVLCFTEEVDEFCVKMLTKYDDKEFVSVESGLAGELETTEIDEKLKDKIKKCLDGKIVDVKGSKALKNHPVCLSSVGEISIEMEKVFAQMPNGGSPTAQKVLEINVEHPIYQKMLSMLEDEKLDKVINVLYSQARLIQGLNVDDAMMLTDNIFDLIV